ncbi:MAG: hypothetical protein JSV68_20680 [Anaerolineaceae bacterium]|nr:MAG: hypothetical protein JSV68_20680 [Anaerolineaceae bacterium]
MARSRYSLILILLLTIVSCQQSGIDSPQTPTPFAVVAATPRASSADPIAISLTHLAANPELFEGTTLQLTGQYQHLPQLVCRRDPHPSPATWGIVGDGLLANATGHDAQLRTLLPQGQQLTAEGRWLRYKGPVGCGKSASAQEVWYLSVNRIVDPHPLARITTAPLEIASGPTGIPDASVTPMPSSTGEIPGILQTATIESVPTVTIAPLAATETSVAPPAATPSPLPSPSPTPPQMTETAIATNTAVTITATSTVTGTPVEGTASATPQSSATPSDREINDKGLLDFEDLAIATLNSGVIDNWTMNIDNSDAITVTVAPATSVNIVLSILDDNGVAIDDRQDRALAGGVETITNLSLTEPGPYQLYISTEPDDQTTYAVMILDDESYNFTFKGTLDDNSPRNDTLKVDNDHFWFFPASDGDNIDMTVTPIGQTDPYLELYGSDATRLLTIDNTGSGEQETLENYSILANGMYAIRVGEFDFAEMSYRISLSKS